MVQPARAKSKGEHLFDRVVYGGFAWVGTFIVTLKAAFSIKYGRWKGGYDSAVVKTEGLLKRVMPSIAGRKAAEQFVQTGALMQGGNLMLLPIGIAEHYKVPIVNGLNRMLGDTTPAEQIEERPQQTWWSLIEGRLVAFAVIFSTLFGASALLSKTFATFTEEFGERTHKVVQWVKGKTPLAGEAVKGSKSYRYGELAALDIFATTAAATLLYVVGHFFARKQEEKKERKALKQAEDVPFKDEASEVIALPAATVAAEREHAGMMQQAPHPTISKA